MNAERLHAVAKAIHQDLKDAQERSLLEQLTSALQNQVNQPQQPNHQQQVSTVLKSLDVALEASTSNDFSPVYRQTLEAIGASELLGRPLLARIRQVFEKNQITPSVALDEIKRIRSEVDLLSKAMEQLLDAFVKLGIDSEELDPGECELGLLIPRNAVKNKLESFASELTLLNKTFGTFSELATGSRPGFDIRTISSTDLTVFLELGPVVCACAAVAIERVVGLYKQLLEIRLLRKQLVEQGVTEKALQGVDSHANSHMKDGIDKVIADLIEKYAANHDEGRRNELRTELRHALNRIANRIDTGYNFEVRVQPIAKSDAKEGVKQEDLAALAVALQASKGVQFLKSGGTPILSLPEPPDPEANTKT